ncbi:MAG: hypothetical protein U0838_00635 [Chloroflexota bacterium]
MDWARWSAPGGCDREGAAPGRADGRAALMHPEIAAYNDEVDCRVMAEILAWLREHR